MIQLIYIWALLVAQKVKTLPVMWETWVQSLGWKDTLEKGMATHSSILALENSHKNLRAILETWVPSLGWEATDSVFLPGEFHGLRSLASYSSWDLKESETTEQLTHTRWGL